MRYLGSEDVCDVIVEYWNGISPSHWQGCESECSEWTLEGREVARRFGDSAFIIADEQIIIPAQARPANCSASCR